MKSLCTDDIVVINSNLRNDLRGRGLRKYPVLIKRGPVKFNKVEMIPSKVESSLAAVVEQLNSSLGRENIKMNELCLVIAKFWHDFLYKIHPFSDGNGRTARLIVLSILQPYNLVIPNFFLLRSFESTGIPEEDIRMLNVLFKISIKNKKAKKEI